MPSITQGLTMKRLALAVAALALIGYAALGINTIVSKQQRLELNEVKLKSTTSELKDLQLQYDQLNSNLDKELHQNDTDQQKVKQLESERLELQKQKQDLEAQLQARIDAKNAAAAKVAAATNALTGTATASAATDLGSAKLWIYSHESGNNPGSVAGNGACGLGQALPCSKLPCGLADYACQDTWFTNYMVSRYGTWENAKATWIARATYINGDYRGGWW